MTDELQSFLNRHIPATEALGIRICAADRTAVRTLAPFETNRNHHQTVFGGSQALLATLTAWALVHLNFPEADGRIVIRSSRMNYLKPAAGDLSAESVCPDEDTLAQTRQQLLQKGRAKITVFCRLSSQGQTAAEWQGEFVVLSDGH